MVSVDTWVSVAELSRFSENALARVGRPPRHPVVGTATKGGEAELRLEFPLRRASSRIQRDHRVIEARGDVHRAADHDLRQMLRVLRHPSGAIADVEPAGATCGRVT